MKIKNLVSGILAMAMVAGCNASLVSANAAKAPKIGDCIPANGNCPSYIVGDITNDGKVNVTDLSVLTAYVKQYRPLDKAKYGPFVELRADNNLDGKINLTDLVRMIAYIKNIK